MAALVLAAGEGHRLRPLTGTLPKALCPVGNVALIDRALARLTRFGFTGPNAVAVNVCYLADQVVEHVGGRAFISREPGPPALGTSGAVAHLRDWVAGRPLLVGNSDAYLAPHGDDIGPLFDGWDGTTVRVLVVPAEPGRVVEFEPGLRFAGFTLLPAEVVAAIPDGVAELVKTVWRPAERAGRLELIRYDGEYIDTGTPPDYLAANLHAAGQGSLVAADAKVTGEVVDSVIGAGAEVAGRITRTVVLPGGRVAAGEALSDAVRQGADITVDCLQ